MPACEAGHLDRVRRRVDAGPPVDDAVAPGVDRRERDAGRQRLPALVEALRAQLPATHSSDISPGTPARLSRTSTSTLVVSSTWWAPGASIGLPMVTIPEIRSGRRTARPRASMPPRLWPTMWTRLPRLIAIDSIRVSRLGGRGERAADVGVDVRAVGAEAAAAQGAAHRPERRVPGHEARDQDHRLLGARLVAGGVRRRPAAAPLVERLDGVAAGLEDHAALAQHLERARAAEPLRQEEGAQRRVLVPGARARRP